MVGSSFIVAMSSAMPGVSLSLPRPAASNDVRQVGGRARRPEEPAERHAEPAEERLDVLDAVRLASSSVNCARLAAFTTRAGRPLALSWTSPADQTSPPAARA